MVFVSENRRVGQLTGWRPEVTVEQGLSGLLVDAGSD
jgi:hypothetical protein